MNRVFPSRVALTSIGCVLLAVMLFPVYWMVNSSLQTGSSVNETFFPIHPNFSAYGIAINQQLGNLGTSLAIALGTAVVALVIAAPAAYGLASFFSRWNPVVLIGLLIAQMIPGIVIANSLFAIYNKAGLLNSIGGLIAADAATAIPFAILVMKAFMDSLPSSLVEAAQLDGASHFRIFWSIVLPVSTNALITAGLFSFLAGWGDFLFALTLTTGSGIRTITLGIYNYLESQQVTWAPVMATGVLASIPAIVLLVFAQRYIAAGALGGSIR